MAVPLSTASTAPMKYGVSSIRRLSGKIFPRSHGHWSTTAMCIFEIWNDKFDVRTFWGNSTTSSCPLQYIISELQWCLFLHVSSNRSSPKYQPWSVFAYSRAHAAVTFTLVTVTWGCAMGSTMGSFCGDQGHAMRAPGWESSSPPGCLALEIPSNRTHLTWLHGWGGRSKQEPVVVFIGKNNRPKPASSKEKCRFEISVTICQHVQW